MITLFKIIKLPYLLKYEQQIRFVYLLLLATLFSSQLQAKNTPVPGFIWQQCPKGNCSLLVPEQWNIQFIRENLPIKFAFTHKRKKNNRGVLQVSILADAEKQTGMSVEKHLKELSQDIQLSGQVLNTWKRESDIFSSVALSSIQYAKEQRMTHQQFSLLVINKETGTLYMINFKAPIQRWEKEWHLFQRTFSQLRLDNAM